jgi:hypothetical protein
MSLIPSYSLEQDEPDHQVEFYKDHCRTAEELENEYLKNRNRVWTPDFRKFPRKS